MTTVTLTAQPDSEWTTVAFRYDPEVIAILKGASSGLRSYDPASKSWSIHESIEGELTAALTKAGHWIVGEVPVGPPVSVEDFFADPKAAKAAQKAEIAALAERIVAEIPAQHVGKVFRAMAKILYPDLYAR